MKKFRIYPENKSLYYLVHIFDTKKEMYEFNKQAFEKGYSNNKTNGFEAQCSSSKEITFKNNKEKLTPKLGDILFYKKSFDRAGIISHEMTHATTYYLFTRKKVKAEDWEEWDELYAYIQGNLTAQYWYNFYKYFESN